MWLTDMVAVVSEILERRVCESDQLCLQVDFGTYSLRLPVMVGPEAREQWMFHISDQYDSILLDKCLLLLIFAIMIVMPHCLRHEITPQNISS